MTEHPVSYERVPFRFIVCPHCSHQMCWINPRLPSYCPECGKSFAGHKERVMMADDEAVLMTHNIQLAGGDYVDRPEGFPGH